MKRYLKKYSILLIVIVALQGLLNWFVVSQMQIILMNMGVEFTEVNHMVQFTLFNIPYFMNVIMAIFILSDLLKNKVKGIPVVLLTVFSHFAGVIFFLFLINNKIRSYEQ